MIPISYKLWGVNLTKKVNDTENSTLPVKRILQINPNTNNEVVLGLPLFHAMIRAGLTDSFLKPLSQTNKVHILYISH